MIYYSLSSHIYAVKLRDVIIILDSKNDDYLSLIDDAAYYFELIFKEIFDRNDNQLIIPVNNASLDIDDLNDWILYFLENDFIIESSHEKRKRISPGPLQQGGLVNYQWDSKTSWQPFAGTSKLEILKSLLTLHRVHRLLKKGGIQPILQKIDMLAKRRNTIKQPTEQEIKALSNSVDAASILYPKKSFCLAWASTFTLRALKKNWQVQLVMGVQNNPFYAHAWAEIDSKVIHDDPVIAQVLAIILKEPKK